MTIQRDEIISYGWEYAAAAGGIVNTSDVAIRAAQAGLRNYVAAVQIKNAHATVSTEVVIKDGSTIIWRGHFKAAGDSESTIVFPKPLRGSVNTALNVACITTGAAVYVNAQGFSASL